MDTIRRRYDAEGRDITHVRSTLITAPLALYDADGGHTGTLLPMYAGPCAGGDAAPDECALHHAADEAAEVDSGLAPVRWTPPGACG